MSLFGSKKTKKDPDRPTRARPPFRCTECGYGLHRKCQSPRCSCCRGRGRA